MKKHFQSLVTFFMTALTVLACSTSFNVVETQPPAPTQVSAPTEPATTETPILLPQSLYYLAMDSQGITQVFRMERDGKNTTQLTHELINVLDYDISLTDQHLVYEVDNQLILVNADGSNRQVLVEGPTRSITRGFYSPVFSPDGKTLAYSENGLNLFDLATSTSNLVLENTPLGGSLPPELFVPDKFSPDGAKLLLEVGHPPDSPWSAAIYTLATDSLTPITNDDPSLSCCTMYGGAEWAADGSSLYAVATTPDSSTPFGALWKVDASTGMTTTLIPGSAGDGNMLLFYQVVKPHLATSGQLYFFSAKYPEHAELIRRVPLLAIRTLPDDINTNWTVLRPETFELMNEALWAPDGSFVITVTTPDQDVYQGGSLAIYYTDMQRGTVPLSQSGSNLKWGP